MFKKLWSTAPAGADLGLLLLRVTSGLLLAVYHGWPKFQGFAERSTRFSDPFGISSQVSLTLTVFAELFCGVLIAIGLFTRLALIPLVVVMAVIVLIIHGADPLKTKEYALLLLVTYITLFFTGPGRYSVDAALKR